MALDKLAHPVLPHLFSPKFFYKVLDNMTGGGHSPISKGINSIN
jgi:hypothetical protein